MPKADVWLVRADLLLCVHPGCAGLGRNPLLVPHPGAASPSTALKVNLGFFHLPLVPGCGSVAQKPEGFLALLSLCGQVAPGVEPRFGEPVLLSVTAHHSIDVSSAKSRRKATKHKTAK